jgi:putative ABC transport system permease protein
MFVGESLRLSLIGVVIGVGISAAASKVLTAFLFGLRATDVATFVGSATMLCLVAVLASYIPARRAARVDPLIALRHE